MPMTEIELNVEVEREQIAQARREIIRDGERFLARNQVPSHLVRSMKATMQRCRDALANVKGET